MTDDGYVATPEANLVRLYKGWPKIQQQLRSGQGGELAPDNTGRAKFASVYSSAALCVNSFAPFLDIAEQLIIGPYSNFATLEFEKKAPTGISTPNLDVYTENAAHIVGIESKFTEHQEKKLPNSRQKGENAGSLDKYENRRELDYLPPSFSRLIEHYRSLKEPLHIDAAQLIKHAIGLQRNALAIKKAPTLVYLYWEPVNHSQFPLFVAHKAEVEYFSAQMRPVMDFLPISYLEFWDSLKRNNQLSEILAPVEKRYRFAI